MASDLNISIILGREKTAKTIWILTALAKAGPSVIFCQDKSVEKFKSQYAVELLNFSKKPYLTQLPCSQSFDVPHEVSNIYFTDYILAASTALAVDVALLHLASMGLRYDKSIYAEVTAFDQNKLLSLLSALQKAHPKFQVQELIVEENKTCFCLTSSSRNIISLIEPLAASDLNLTHPDLDLGDGKDAQWLQ